MHNFKIIFLLLSIVFLTCSCNGWVRDIQKGVPFFEIKVTDQISLEFVRDYDWDVSAGVEVIVHRSTDHPIRTATIDLFVPDQEATPKYGIIKSSKGIIGIYNKNNPREIVMLLDTTDFTHLPERSQYSDIVRSDKMVESFFKEYPDYFHYLKKGRE